MAKRNKDKQRSTKQTHKTKDRVTQTQNAGALEGLSVLAPLVTPVMLL